MNTPTRIQQQIGRLSSLYKDNEHGQIIFLCDFIGFVSSNLLPEDASYLEAQIDQAERRLLMRDRVVKDHQESRAVYQNESNAATPDIGSARGQSASGAAIQNDLQC